MSDRPTPETDKIITDWMQGVTKELPNFVEIARNLERERDEAIRQRDETNRSSKYACDYNYEQKLKAERERDEAKNVASELALQAERLRKQRDEAREKIKRQAERIRELEGATNHAGGMKKIESIKYHGTDETDAMVELWESCHLPADFARRMEAERNEARRLADTRLDQLEAITSSEPKDYLGLVYACKSHRKHIAQLIKERDEAREALKTLAQHGESEIQRLIKERDEAREILRELYFAVQRKFAEWAPKNNINAASEEAAK